ncbi:MAG TPA: acetylglutamate kinase [Chloroflexota bacterium]|nr:acetylglutamate kinase [Chloroflexota bacterium]
MSSRIAPTPPEVLELASRIDSEGATQALLEALPYIARFVGKTVVVKIGGSIGQDGTALEDVVTLYRLGVKPVIVHGGGPLISEWQERLGLEPKFVQGRRFTDELTLDLARMVLIGKVNSDLIAHLCALGAPAVGLSGIDGGMIRARLRDPKLGLVGEVVDVDLTPLRTVMGAGYLAVVAPAAVDPQGQPLNVNADSIAGDLARALEAEKLVFFTDVAGVLAEDGSLLSTLSTERVRELIASGQISGGMIPKAEACVRALDTVPRAHVLDGRVPHALLRELFTDTGVGTMIMKDTEGD